MIDSQEKKNYLDLRGTPCPINFVRCKLALEALSFQEELQVHLDSGEPKDTVISGLRNEGYMVEVIVEDIKSVKLKVVSTSD